MPEGDTVWRAARLLDRQLAGRVLTFASLNVPRLAEVDLVGATVIETRTHGKHLLTRFQTVTGDQLTLHTHLKMEGSWHAVDVGQKWRRPAHQARVVLTAGPHSAVGFSLGLVELLPTSAEGEIIGHLGPDLLGDWSPEDETVACRNLAEQPTRTLRAALLDQRNVAGIGNMYAAELCFLAGALPTSPVAKLTESQAMLRLLRQARQMLLLNRERPIQCTTGDLRQGNRLWVYRRDRQPCRRCGARIRVDNLGEAGRERAAYWCPQCQT